MECEWGELPSVCLLEVYNYLSVSDRLRASSSCKNWRASAFQLPLNQHLKLTLASYEDIPKVRFLGQFAHKVRSLLITFNATNPIYIDKVEEILLQIEGSCHLRTLKIRFSEDCLGGEVFNGSSNSALIIRKYLAKKVFTTLIKVLQGKIRLESFSFPLPEVFVHFGNIFFTILSNSKMFVTKNLSLYSICTNFAGKKIEQNNNEVLKNSFNITNISNFIYLQTLNLDYNLLSDEILSKIGAGSLVGGIRRLFLIAYRSNSSTSNNGWINLTQNNPNCKVRLTICGSGVVVDHNSNLLFPAIPLTHFRSLYAKGIKVSFLNSLVIWNMETLEHLELVDENHEWLDAIAESENIDQNQFLDPIIFAAWRCKKLQVIKIGFMYCGRSLIGIARLKGSKLLKLEIPKSQIVYHNHQQLREELSISLERPWKPTDEKPAKKLVNTYRTLLSDDI